MSLVRRMLILTVALLSVPAFAFSPQSLVITPTEFDFGWCPDNSKITAEFTIRNTGTELIPITSVQPTCGCTASQFTPGNLTSNQETKVGLTFNTRGYARTGFSKATKVKTEAGGAEYDVILKGYVLDPAAKIIPDGDGIASFEPDTKGKKKTITIQNKSDKDVTLAIVQAPAAWASVKFSAGVLKAGASLPVEISVNSPFSETKDTSVTLEARSETETSRVTLAIRTGNPPPPIKRATMAPAPAPVPNPEKKPEK